MQDQVHISALIVYVRPKFIKVVQNSIAQFTGCEIASTDEKSKIIVVLETSNTLEITDIQQRVLGLDGVINTVMAYHHVEESKALDEVYG